ncbi:MAG: site-specific integrase [Dehalococcoidia bacterium]|nr:MAG: site-specific integrase [Dehalococcoidia bacterium]
MLGSNGKIVRYKNNLFMTTDELKAMFRELRKWDMKYTILFGLCAFRGMRISEACAVNIYDFKDQNFDVLTYRTAKSNKVVSNKPIIKPFAELIRNYVINNKHRLVNGFLFPHYNSINKLPYISPGAAQAAFSKIRRSIAKTNPGFSDRYEYFDGGWGKTRFRISTHSLRRWFETHLALIYKDPFLIKEIMNYDELNTINHYISAFEYYKREPEVLEKTFSSLFCDVQNIAMGQKRLIEF